MKERYLFDEALGDKTKTADYMKGNSLGFRIAHG